MAMPLELFSTESAYYLFAERPTELNESLEISVGYLEVVLTTATISFLLFLVEVARKLGLMARIAMIYNKRRDGEYSLKYCQCKAEDSNEVSCCSSKCSSSSTVLIGPPRDDATISAIASTFSSALPNRKLVEWVRASLEAFGFIGENAMLCTSFCCDELNRSLELDLSKEFGDNFNIGGLAGFAFGGLTGFGAMASHIPANGNCLIVYGPHVGIDSKGNIGTAERRGLLDGGACCGSGVAALRYVNSVHCGEKKANNLPVDPLDVQQGRVEDLLLPYADQLAKAKDPMVELPFSLFQAQDKLMQEIVQRKREMISSNGRIALLGGIQINTPDGVSDYFLPLRFDVVKSSGNEVVDLLFEKTAKKVENPQ